MSLKLKDILETDPELNVEVVTHPIERDDGVKVYKIEIDQKPYFDWQVNVKAAQPKPEIKVAPNEKWQTPVNFETHVKVFGEHKAFQVAELKAAILHH